MLLCFRRKTHTCVRAGFVGILPAIGLLTDQERGSVAKEQPWWYSYSTASASRQALCDVVITLPACRALFLWSFALAFFGVFFAVPLRKQTILREKLPFPSGSFQPPVLECAFFIISGIPPSCAGTATAHLIKILHGQAASFEKNQVYSYSSAQ